MKTFSALPVAAALAVSAAIVLPGSPVQAGGIRPTCSFSPGTISATVDPTFFELSNPEDVTPDMFDPVSTSITPTSDIPDGEASVSFNMTIGGEEYGPVTVDGAGPIGTSGTPLEFPSIGILGFAGAIGDALFDQGDSEFLADFPDQEAFLSAFFNPQSYPMSIEFIVSDSGGPLCSIMFNLEAGSTSTRPCSGPYGHLCDYLDQRTAASETLPNTL